MPADQGRETTGHSYAPFLRGESPALRNRLYFEHEHLRGILNENLEYVERTGE